MNDSRDRRLLVQGFLLILIALIVGMFVQRMPNPRMGLATHLEALLLGMMLLLLGLLWHRFSLPDWAFTVLAWFPIVGAHCSVVMHLFAALFPSGEYWMPIAAAGLEGALWQEWVVTIGVVVIGVTMLPAMAVALWGLFRNQGREDPG